MERRQPFKSSNLYVDLVRDNRIIVGECVWLDLNLIKGVLNDCRKLFPVTGYASITIPTYPCGQIGMIMASLNQVII